MCMCACMSLKSESFICPRSFCCMIFTGMCVYICTCVCVRVCMNIHACTHSCMCVCIYTYINVHKCMYVYVQHMYIYIYIHMHTYTYFCHLASHLDELLAFPHANKPVLAEPALKHARVRPSYMPRKRCAKLILVT